MISQGGCCQSERTPHVGKGKEVCERRMGGFWFGVGDTLFNAS